MISLFLVNMVFLLSNYVRRAAPWGSGLSLVRPALSRLDHNLSPFFAQRMTAIWVPETLASSTLSFCNAADAALFDVLGECAR
jgi:hypothetical protein